LPHALAANACKTRRQNAEPGHRAVDKINPRRSVAVVNKFGRKQAALMQFFERFATPVFR
jgi:hypothetical protein